MTRRADCCFFATVRKYHLYCLGPGLPYSRNISIGGLEGRANQTGAEPEHYYNSVYTKIVLLTKSSWLTAISFAIFSFRKYRLAGEGGD